MIAWLDESSSLRRSNPRCRHLACAPVNFEKWQALGNDYVILESARLAVRADAEPGAAVSAPRTPVSRSDGILLLVRPDEPGFVAGMRIFNPDGSEAELSGNGAREAILYLRRRGWTERGPFSIQTAAGEIRATITSPTTCTVDMGRARAAAALTIPRATPTAAASCRRRAALALPARPGRQSSVCDRGRRRARARRARPAGDRTGDRAPRAVPEPHERLLVRPSLGPGRIRARIFERGVGETSASGTGAIGAAVAHVLRGGDSPVTVVLDGGELEVEVGEDLHINLTGWAVPVFAGRSPRNSSRTCVRPSSRLEQIPPYLFAELERKIAAKRAAGIDVISLGIGDPDTPTYPPIVAAAQARGRRPEHAPVPDQPRAGRSSARPSPRSTRAASASRSIPRPR